MSHHRFRARNGFDAEKQRSVNLGDPLEWNDPAGARDFVSRDWILNRTNWTQLAGRVGDLPRNTLASPVRDGATHLIKYRFGGDELSRLAVWDSTKTQVGGIAVIRVTVPAAEIANVQTEAGLGSSWPGEVFTGGNNDGVFDITPNNDGTVSVVVTTAGTGYGFGDVYKGGPYGAIGSLEFEVNQLAGASSTGGWRFVDTESWVKATQAEIDVQTDRVKGDFQSTIEVSHKELKVFANNTWITLFSEDDIKAWIASLSLFEGTVKEEGGSAVGAGEFHGLPDLGDLSRRKVLGQISHYWTFVGAPNTEIVAEYDIAGLTGGVPGTYQVTTTLGTTATIRVLTATTAKVGIRALAAGTINAAVLNVAAGALGTGSSASTFTVPDVTKVATPIIGTDLAGALLNPGDWVQVSNRGTATTPDLHWVTIGGDLLAKARADKLFSLQQWVDGSWEKGALITNNGAIYRAKQAIITGNPIPGAGAAVAQVNVLTITAPTAAGQAYTLDVNGNAATYTTAAGDGIAEVRQGLIDEIGKVAAILRLATPSAGGKPEELALTAATPGTAFTATMQTANLASVTTVNNVVATTNPWEKVNLSGGVRWVQTDGDLPANAPPGEIYFVLASALAGGAGRLTYWDGGAAKWQDLGGGAGGTPLKLDGGIIVYPDVIYWDGTGTKPTGKVVNDLLYHSSTNVVQRWDGTAWINLLVNVPYGTAGNKDKFVIANTAGDPTWSGKTFEDAVKDAAQKVFPTVSAPAEDKPDNNGDVGSFAWRSVKPGTQHTWVLYPTTKLEPLLYFDGSSTAGGVTKHLYIQGELMVGGVGTVYDKNYSFQRDDNQAKTAYWYGSLDYGDDPNYCKAGRMAMFKTTWFESKKKDHQFMYYEYWYRRKMDDRRCIIFGRIYLPGAAANPVTGYAINAYSHDKIAEAYVY